MGGVPGGAADPGDSGSRSEGVSSPAPGRTRRAEVMRQPVSMPSRRKRTRLKRRVVGESPNEASWSASCRDLGVHVGTLEDERAVGIEGVERTSQQRVPRLRVVGDVSGQFLLLGGNGRLGVVDEQLVGEKGTGVDSLDLGNDSPTPPPPPHEQRTSSPTCPFRGAIHPPDQGSGRRAEDGLGRSVAESLWSGCRGCPAGSAGPAFLFTWSYLESFWRYP